MQIAVPAELRRQLETHRARPGYGRKYPRHLKAAVISWTKSQQGRHSIRALAASVEIGWDTLQRWLSEAETFTAPATPPGDAPRSAMPVDPAEPRFLPVRIAGAEERSCSTEAIVEVLVRGGRTVRVRWPAGSGALTEVVAALEAMR